MRLFLVLLAIFAVAPSTWGWSGRGHRIVGQLAQERLSAKAKLAIKQILGDGFSLAKESTWADEVKNNPAFARFESWHFVEIAPLKDQDLFSDRLLAGTVSPARIEPHVHEDEVSAAPPAPSVVEQDMAIVRSLGELIPYALATHNPEGDALRGIAFCKWILTSPYATPQQKVLALRFLVHLVGDIMQPLHVGNGLDSGGNSCLIKWQGKEQTFLRDRVVDITLHGLWDELIVDEKKCPRGRNSPVMIACSHVQWAKLLSEKYDADPRTDGLWKKGEAFDWAFESSIVRDRIYPVIKNAEGQLLEVTYKDEQGRILADRKGFPGRPYCRPKTPKGGRAAVVESVYKPDLGVSYYEEWEITLEEQLYKGGLRLAKLLNEIFENSLEQ